MKTMRKLWTLFLSLALMLSLVTGIPVTANAEETTGDITVTLRVEQDYSTVLAPVNVTLTESDKAKDFGLSGLEGKNSPLKALAKYFSTEKNVSDDDMSKYINVTSGGFLNSISWDGKDVTNPCETMLDGTSYTQFTAWSYSVKSGDNTNAEGSDLITQYELKDNDSISICGLFSEYSADYSSTLAGFSSSFDQDQYAASTGKAINVTLNQNNFGDRSACEGATILAAKLSDTVLTATKDNASVTASTDKEGKASLTFKEAGTYVLSAYKTASDKIHSTIARPYAVVYVTDDATVTLRIEQDNDTVLAPVQVTLLGSELFDDYGIDGLSGTNSPLKALAKYFSTEKNVSDDDMSKYIAAPVSTLGGLYLSSISLDGKTVIAPGTDASVSWMYDVNNVQENVAISDYDLKDKDTVTIYGLYQRYDYDKSTDSWNLLEGFSSAFDQTAYTAKAGQALSVTLNQSSYLGTAACENATILAAKSSDSVVAATKDNAAVKATTGKDGKASLTFSEAGTYVLSAYKLAEDGIHNAISRPYAVVTVSAADAAKDTNTDKKNTISSTLPAVTPVQVNTAVMPAKVKSLKAKVPKNKKTKKSVKFTWKKAKNATAYQIYISKKKKSGYKKQATTTSLKKTLKLKKGTYYVKVRAYNKSGNFYKYGKFSTVLKVKVKNKK